MTEFCNNCGKEYDGGYPCSECGSVNFVKEKDASLEKKNGGSE